MPRATFPLPRTAPAQTAPQSVAPTVAEALARDLASAGQPLFGLMGNGNAYLIDAARDAGMHYVSLRHEGGVVAAADGYHRATGHTALATVTYGPGFTNVLTALQEAQLAMSALVLIAGDAPTTGPRVVDTRQSALAEAIGVPTVQIATPGEAVGAGTRALRLARETSGPVVLALPSDLAVARVPTHSAPPPARPPGNAPVNSPASDPGLDNHARAELATAAGLLRHAQRPLIVLGRGAVLAGASASLAPVAEAVGAASVATLPAWGHQAFGAGFLGVLGGLSTTDTRAATASADVVLVVGARLNSFTLDFGHALDPGATVIQVDTRAESRSSIASRFIQADAHAASAALARLLSPAPDTPRASWATSRDESDAPERSDPEPPGPRASPRRLAEELDRILPHGCTIASDLGNFFEWIPRASTSSSNRRFITVGSAFQSIGLGLPSAIGAALRGDEGLTVLATGDGGLLMSLADLESFVRVVDHGLIIVFNDGAYGAELHQYAAWGLDPAPMTIGDVDFARMGRALGAEGVTVRRLADLHRVSAWLDSGMPGTLVVDCKITDDEVGPALAHIATTIARPEPAASP